VDNSQTAILWIWQGSTRGKTVGSHLMQCGTEISKLARGLNVVFPAMFKVRAARSSLLVYTHAVQALVRTLRAQCRLPYPSAFLGVRHHSAGDRRAAGRFVGFVRKGTLDEGTAFSNSLTFLLGERGSRFRCESPGPEPTLEGYFSLASSAGPKPTYAPKNEGAGASSPSW
jgi:hypothetical protein